MKKFELFMCYLGNGLTVCNKAVEEHGEYQHVAHISNAGNIKWYIPVASIPGPDLLRIEHVADVMAQRFKQATEREIAANKARAYYLMCDCLEAPNEMHRFFESVHGLSDDEKIEKLLPIYLARS